MDTDGATVTRMINYGEARIGNKSMLASFTLSALTWLSGVFVRKSSSLLIGSPSFCPAAAAILRKTQAS